MKKWIATVLLLAAFLPLPVGALDDGGEGYWRLEDGSGALLTHYAGAVQVGDEYLAGDNRFYRVTVADESSLRAVAVFQRQVTLPLLVSPVAQEEWVPRIALYCTHTDEAYVPDSGAESVAEGGDILEVAESLTQALNENGCQAVQDDTNHVPHDAGAYRRSRRTAAALMKENQPTLLVDVHRDGVPAEEYEKDIQGEDASRVRIVIGRGNQNRAANEEFALQVKSVADSLYPGLVKDIYFGKGSYNQDLMSRAILLEFGTHEIEKERVLASTEFMGHVLASALGAKTKTETTAAPSSATEATEPTIAQSPSATAPPVQAQTPPDSSGGAGKSIAIIAGVLILIGVAVWLIYARGQGRVGRFFRELTGTGNRKE